MFLGVDYYPEHWPADMQDEDIKGIQDMGANAVRIGEFAWHIMEKKPGNYDFSFFDGIIEKLDKAGLKTVFGTPTATFPAWLAKKHPDILIQDENGRQMAFGGRRQYCFNSDIYLEYSLKLVSQLVEHYRDNVNVIAWQIDNEFGHEGSDMCWCDNCHKAFHGFLENKYMDIEELNRTYGTVFWGQQYNSFDEIPMPLKTITTHNPSLKLDWARFRSKSLTDFAKKHIELVRKLKGDHQRVTTNFAGGFFDKWFDHKDLAKQLDFTSYDNYPVWGGLREPVHQAQTAMHLDFIRGLTGENFWILEQLMGAQGHDVIGYLPRPDQAKMWSYQAMAHGCSSFFYFRWRAMTKGAEQYCYGIVDHDNVYGRKYQEAKEFFNEIKNHSHLFDEKIMSDVAVLYDHENVWSWKAQTQSEAFDFNDEILRLYRPFHSLNVNIDVVPCTEDFEKYKVIAVPVMKIIDESLAQRLKSFAANGGTIIFSFRAGIKDKDNNINFKSTPPCRISELCGISIKESESLASGKTVDIESSVGITHTAGVWRDIITPITAETIYSYSDMFYSDKACITKNKYLEGSAYYIGAGTDEEVLIPIFEDILKEKAIDYIKAERDLEVYPRKYKNEDYLVITNHDSSKKKFRNINVAPYQSIIIKR